MLDFFQSVLALLILVIIAQTNLFSVLFWLLTVIFFVSIYRWIPFPHRLKILLRKQSAMYTLCIGLIFLWGIYIYTRNLFPLGYLFPYPTTGHDDIPSNVYITFFINYLFWILGGYLICVSLPIKWLRAKSFQLSIISFALIVTLYGLMLFVFAFD
ncbi:MAG TPA: hypothetical protein VJB63_01530 [Patescibacteria group bacterium]|nr:hypothetical protein [Patescibacteria group bacterium]